MWFDNNMLKLDYLIDEKFRSCFFVSYREILSDRYKDFIKIFDFLLTMKKNKNMLFRLAIIGINKCAELAL